MTMSVLLNFIGYFRINIGHFHRFQSAALEQTGNGPWFPRLENFKFLGYLRLGLNRMCLDPICISSVRYKMISLQDEPKGPLLG